MKNKLIITKMIDGTYKAWRKRTVTRTETYKIIEDANGDTEQEAKDNFSKQYENI